jgi:hypothetical protein
MIWFLIIILCISLIALFGGGYVIKMVESESTNPSVKMKMNKFRVKWDGKIDLALKIFNWALAAFIIYVIVTGTYYER